MLKVLCLCAGILATAGVSIAQEKAVWTATPGSVSQQNKAYPSSVMVRIVVNNCYDKNGNVEKPLKQSDGYTVTVTGVGVSASTPTVGECSLSTKLTISDGTPPAIQMLMVKKGAEDVGFAPFAFMDATAGRIPADPEVDVLWEVLTDHLCRDNFGNHMPGDLYCIEAKIGNNSGYSLQLAGVGFSRKSPVCQSPTDSTPRPCTTNDISISNISYSTARASAQAGQSTTARNLVVNGTQAVGLLMASFTPFFLNSFHKSTWAASSAIVGTSLAQAINIIAPDQTLKEINNLDDQAFRDNKVIPNNTQVRLLVFVQKRSLADAIGELVPQIKNADEIKSPCTVGYKEDSERAGYCFPAWEGSLKNCIKKLSCDPFVVKLALGRMVIVGDKIDYIERVVVASSPTSQEASAAKSPLDPTHGAVGTDVTITGTGFGADKGTVKFGDTAATDIESWADAKIVVKVPAEAKTAEVVVTAGGKEGKDQKIGTFTVDAAAKPGLNPTHGAVGTDVTITGTGFGADKGTVQFGGIAATDITKWADTKIVVIVPARAKSGNVVVEVRGKGRIVGTFSIR
jgi:hypothetical protein